MRERSLKRRTAFILAVLLTFMNCFSSFASETTDVNNNPEINETVDDINNKVNNDNTNASGEEETSGAVSSVSDTDTDEELTEEATEESTEVATLGSIEESTEETSEITIDEESVSDDNSTSSDQIESEEEEAEAGLPVASLRATRALSMLGSVNPLGALNTGTDTVSEGNPAREDGYTWWVENEVALRVSVNRSGVTIAAMKNKLRVYSIDAATITSIIITDNENDYLLGSTAFNDFTGISSFSVKSHLIEIKSGAFSGCSGLEEMNVESSEYFSADNGVLYNKDYTKLLFVPAKKTELIINPNTVSICESAAEKTNISGKLTIPSKVTTIEKNAFYNCKSITQLDFGNCRDRNDESKASSCTRIGQSAFQNCSNLKRVFLPSTITNVGDYAFSGDTSLEYLFFYGAHNTEDDKDVTKLKTSYGLLGIPLDQKHWVCIPFGQVAVLFNPNGGYWDGKAEEKGTTVSTINIGTAFGQLKEPTPGKATQVFDCWQDESTGGEFDPGTNVDIDMFLKAHYTSYYTVTFKYEDIYDTSKSIFIKDVTVEQGKTLTASDIPEPYQWGIDGISFRGWYSSLKGGPFTNSVLLDPNEFKIGQNHTFTARYTKLCKVTYSYRQSGNEVILSSCNVAENKPIPNFNTILADEAEVLERVFPSRNWTFVQWLYKGNAWYAEKIVTEDVNLVADYQQFFKSSFYFGDRYVAENSRYYSTDTDPLLVITSDYPNTGIDLPPVWDLPHYRFDGWYRDPEYTRVARGNVVIDEDGSFYAKWTPKHYVTFYNTQVSDTEPYGDPIEIVSGDKIGISLPDGPDDIRDASGNNLAFMGWYTERNGGGINVNRKTVVNEPMYAYSFWGEGYTVKIYLENGGEELQRSVRKGGSKIGSLPNVENRKLGYIFVSWNTAPDGTGMNVTKDTVISSPMAIYGIWEDDPNVPNDPQVTVSYNSMGGSEVIKQTLSVNTLISRPVDPTWTDHKFIGWYTSPAYEKEWDFDKDIIEADMYLYAKWIDWTEEDEDNAHGIYWVRMLRGGKAPLTEYFKESGLQFSYDKNVVKILQKGRTVKGKRVGETLITATKGDGSEYPVKVRAFVFKQELQDMYAFNTSTTLNAPDFLTVSGFLPDRWESTKPSVATIDSKTGFIQVKGRGRTKIKAYYNNKAVTATLYSEVPKFAKKFYRFKTGQSKKIKIKRVKKYDIVSWNIITESGNSSGKSVVSGGSAGFAEVDNNGLVTAVSAGEVTLQATVYGQTITTKLHIEPPTLKKNQLEIDVNKVKKLKLSRTKLKYVEWKSSNDSVAYVDPTSGKVYALKAGRVTLRTTAGGVTNTCNVIVTDPGATGTSLGKTANSTLKK